MPKPDISLASKIRWLPDSAGLITLGIALVSLAGWILDLPILTRVMPGLPPMQPVTGLAFLLAGSALYLVRRVHNPWALRLAMAGALAVCLVASLTLLEYRVGWDFGMNLWPLPNSDTEPLRSHRMSPHSALAFLLTGSSLLLRGVTAIKLRASC